MPRNGLARVYVAAVIMLACLVAICSAGTWNCSLEIFLGYAALGFLTSAVKVRIPGIVGTFSANCVVTLLAIAHLGLAEAVFISIGCAFVQSLWRSAKPPLLVQLLFNAAVFCLATAATFWIYHTLGEWNESAPSVISFAAASVVFFFVNTLLISGVIGLVEQKPILQVWRTWHLWSFPYYLSSVAFVALLLTTSSSGVLRGAVTIIPLVFAVFLCYRWMVGWAARQVSTTAAEVERA